MSEKLLHDFYRNDWLLPKQRSAMQLQAANCTHFGRSCVDKSQFEPTAQALKAIRAGQYAQLTANSAALNMSYDYADGVDKGHQPPLARRKGVDMAELSQSILREGMTVNEQIMNELKVRDEKSQLDSVMDRLAPRSERSEPNGAPSPYNGNSQSGSTQV